MYATLVLLVGGPIVSMVLLSTRSTTENDNIQRLTERNRTAFLRIEEDLRTSIHGTAVVGDSGRSLTVMSAAGFDGVSISTGPSIQFTLRPSTGEAVNGSDDNGNGLVDEGLLVRRDLSTGVETQISSGIDTSASGFSLSGSGVTVTLASFGILPDRGVYRVSRSVTVYPRN